MSAVFQERIVYPLTALVSINTRHMLFKSKMILPFLVAMVPVFFLAIARAVAFVYPTLEEEISGGYEIYSVLCASFYLQFLVPILALFKGLSVFAEEMNEGTLMYLFLRPVPRTVLVTGKFLAFWLSTSILMLLSLGGTFFLLGSVPDLTMFFEDFGSFIKDLWVLCLGLGVYGVVLMAIGLLLKKSLGVSILVLAWDIVATYIPGSSYLFTIKYYLQSIFPHQRTETGLLALLTYHPPASMSQTLLVFACILIAGIGLSTFIIKFKEYGAMQNVD